MNSVHAQSWLLTACLSGFISVVMGAVGAHLAGDVLSAALIEKASFFQLIHAVVLVWLAEKSQFWLTRWLFIVGSLLFCGALYLKGITGWSWATRPAPMGGVSLMLGWLVLGWTGFRHKSEIHPRA
jgi:uncharacterized membrane protein YgdD (TMEM256/DUF423 family)